MPLRFGCRRFSLHECLPCFISLVLQNGEWSTSLADPVQAMQRDASRFSLFPPGPPCVPWPPANASLPAAAWSILHTHGILQLVVFAGLHLAPLVPPAGGVGGLLLSTTIAWKISLGYAVHPLPNGGDALQPLSSVRWALLQISSRSLAVGSLEPFA